MCSCQPGIDLAEPKAQETDVAWLQLGSGGDLLPYGLNQRLTNALGAGPKIPPRALRPFLILPISAGFDFPSYRTCPSVPSSHSPDPRDQPIAYARRIFVVAWKFFSE